MKVISAILFVSASLIVAINAVSEPICSYKNSQGETVFLKYLPLLKQGQDYVDFGNDGKCVRRASCSDTFKTEVEDCKKYSTITCSNKKNYPGVFPACCIKC